MDLEKPGDGRALIALWVSQGYRHYFAPRGFAARARPLPRVPRSPPRAAPPLPAGAPLPTPPIREVGAGIANFGVAFEDVGGLSTKDVSVVLSSISYEAT
jgi:hypothetical protein